MDAIGDGDLNRLPWIRLNITDGSISSYCSIINDPEQLHMIKQSKEFSYVICDIESGRVGSKEYRKKIHMKA